MHNDQLARLCANAKEAVAETAAFIKGEVGNVTDDKIEQKALNSLVSYVDKGAETLLVKRLSELVPGSVFLTEEDTVTNNTGEYQWIIDPLDGTTNFLHQLPFFSVSVALNHFDKTVIGIVMEVSREELFYSWKGGGAYLNDAAIRVSANNQLSEGLLATGFPYYDFDHIEDYIVALREFMQRCRGIRRFGSAALDLAYVACGRFDGFFEYGLNAWDIAAGMLLVEEAGGRATDFRGADEYLKSGEVLAASAGVYPEMLEVIDKAFVRRKGHPSNPA